MNDVVLTFYIKKQKTNNYYYTFCSPEAVKSIVNYILNDCIRHDTEGNLLLHEFDLLFPISRKYLPGALSKLNDELNLGKAGTYNRLRTHMFRKFHASTLKKLE